MFRRSPKGKRKNRLEHGVVHLRYNDKKLLEQLEHLKNEILLRVGTEAVKRDRLSKGSS